MKYPLLLLALLTQLVLSSTYLVTLPLFEAPDERGHAGYATFVAEHGTPPRIRGSAEDDERWRERAMGHHPPLYYALLAATLHALDADDLLCVQHPDPSGPRDTEGRRRALARAHGHDELAPVSHEVLILRALRAWSVVFGVLTLLLVHRIGLALCPDRPRVAGVAVLGLAAVPAWWMAHGVLDNGNLATTLSTGAVLVLVGATKRERLTLGTGALFGLLAGLAIVTKLTALGVLGVAAWAWGRALVVAPDRRGATAASGLVALGVTLLIAGPFFARNLALYGELLGTSAHAASYHLSRLTPELRARHWTHDLLPSLLHSWAGGLGRGAGPALWHQLGWVALLAAGLAGLARRGRAAVGDGRVAVLALLAGACAALLLARYNLTFAQAQARYLFGGVGPTACLWAAGLVALAGGRVASATACVAAGSSFVLLFGALRPALAIDPALADRWFAIAVLDTRTPAPPERRTVLALGPPDGARLDELPTFRWSTEGHPPDARWTLYLVDAAGHLHGATHEMFGVPVLGGEYRLPPELWSAFEPGRPYAWRVRRLPDRAADERTRDAPESPPRTFVRR